eukprot:Macronucleus_5552.p1 GENE.Macronucleus_5552~~Macronucleus_5552.p1  ORF type:complete len:169 (+),score=12.56 Macronucleus_5552:1-507(+)
MRDKIEKLINKGRIMLFIEGTIDFPTEVHSEELVNIVKNPYYNYPREDLHSFDLRQDVEIKPALLEYCKYRSTPQLYVRQRLVGTLDVVREMHQQGRLKNLLEYREVKKTESIAERFKNRLKQSKKMILQSEPGSPSRVPGNEATTTQNQSIHQRASQAQAATPKAYN